MRVSFKIFLTPHREKVLIVLLAIGLLVHAFFSYVGDIVLVVVAAMGAIPAFVSAFNDLVKRRVGIELFNSFALAVSFIAQDFRSAAFIDLMLLSASLLEWRTMTRTQDAISALMKLKPESAFVVRGKIIKEVTVDSVQSGDMLIVKNGGRIPVDGIVSEGDVLVDESLVTGESMPVSKVVGDTVLAGTINDSGVLKMRATRVGKDSTLERMMVLMREAASHKSRTERIADRFAGIFLPIVALIGLVTYLVTKNITMTASLFLVACADDMAVAIPLAMTAALGRAAERGVIVKGGEWIAALAKVNAVVLDKTGTLTYGKLAVSNMYFTGRTDKKSLWEMIGAAEKYAEHPVGKAVLHEAMRHSRAIPDPKETHVVKGGGIAATVGTHVVTIGTKKFLREEKISVHEQDLHEDAGVLSMKKMSRGMQSFVYVALDHVFAGWVAVEDTPRTEAFESLCELGEVGVKNTVMLTGDVPEVAERVGKTLGISEVYAALKPEEKVRILVKLKKKFGTVAMVGDGVNDAPSLARADVGIAMGGGGTAVAVAAADVVMATDDLSRLPWLITLSKKTMSVIRLDIVIWVISNAFGFVLVFSGITGTAGAAFYNFATDFLPLINSTRLFGKEKKRFTKCHMRKG